MTWGRSNVRFPTSPVCHLNSSSACTLRTTPPSQCDIIFQLKYRIPTLNQNQNHKKPLIKNYPKNYVKHVKQKESWKSYWYLSAALHVWLLNTIKSYQIHQSKLALMLQKTPRKAISLIGGVLVLSLVSGISQFWWLRLFSNPVSSVDSKTCTKSWYSWSWLTWIYILWQKSAPFSEKTSLAKCHAAMPSASSQAHDLFWS